MVRGIRLFTCRGVTRGVLDESSPVVQEKYSGLARAGKSKTTTTGQANVEYTTMLLRITPKMKQDKKTKS